ncbi:MAG: peptidoglycan DD-metalloendopeptidase family protein [Lachnospiraceae bacterium]|nr:peptidoglycan DD-metalloendopeptidase family protein [Lachnospiraceae bacterium]
MRSRKIGFGTILALFLVAVITATTTRAAAPVFTPAGSVIPDVFRYSEDKEEELKKKREKAEQEKNKLEQKQKEIQKQQNALKSEYENIEKYIEEMDQKQNDMLQEIADIEEVIEGLNAELAVTNQELAEAEAREQEQYEALKRRFQYLYEHGNMTELEVLMGSSDLSDILNYDEYATSIRVYDYNLAQRYTQARKDVLAVKETLEAQIAVMETSRALYDQNYEYVQTVIAKKQEALAEYAASIDVTEDDLEEYEQLLRAQKEDIAKLNKEIEAEKERKRQEELKRQAEEAKRRAEEEKKKQQQASQQSQQERNAKYANVPHTGVSSASDLTLKEEKNPNKMIWPLPGDSRTGSGFGPRRAPIKGASTFHNGVDIGAKFGSQIVASLAGTVRYAGYNSTAGNYVEIDHGNGYVTRYLHASKLLVKKGDKVLQGQVIALVGSTGVSTAPHLHFSVVIDGVAVDPLFYIRY